MLDEVLRKPSDDVGRCNDGTEVLPARCLTPKEGSVISHRYPLDGIKSIELKAINIAKEVADLPSFLHAPFWADLLLRLGGLSLGGSPLPLPFFDPFLVCSSPFDALDLAVRQDKFRRDRVVDADDLRVLLDRRPPS